MLVANACSVDFREQIPVYFDAKKVEVMTLEHFKFCLNEMKMVKFTDDERFERLASGLRVEGCLVMQGSTELIAVE